MPGIPDKKGLLHHISAFALTTIAISILGYVDYITGEISIEVLYIVCLCFVAWNTCKAISLLCVFEIISAKVSADFFDNVKIGSHLYEWNTFNYVLMYLVVWGLTVKLKATLTCRNKSNVVCTSKS